MKTIPRTSVLAVPASGQPLAKIRTGPDNRPFAVAAQSNILDQFVPPKKTEEVSKPKLVENIRWMHWAMEEVFKACAPGTIIDDRYVQALELVQSANFSPKDISQLVSELSRYQKESGFYYAPAFFVSALINLSPADDFVLDIRSLGGKVGFWGLDNRKNITLYGNAWGIGAEMTGGTIKLFGNCTGELGAEIKGGRIEVYGHIEELSAHSGADIFQYGFPLIKDGKQVGYPVNLR